MRPFDDQSQPRIHMEALAVSFIMDKIWSGDWQWVAGEILYMEVLADRNAYRRAKVLGWLRFVDEWMEAAQMDENLIRRFMRHGIGEWDAEHLAAAVTSGCDCFVTADHGLSAHAASLKPSLGFRLLNPMELAGDLP
jgi:hypothetical protein